MVCSHLSDTKTDKEPNKVLCGGVYSEQRQTPIQIPIGLCANLSVSVCLVFCVCLGVGQCERTINANAWGTPGEISIYWQILNGIVHIKRDCHHFVDYGWEVRDATDHQLRGDLRAEHNYVAHRLHPQPRLRTRIRPVETSRENRIRNK